MIALLLWIGGYLVFGTMLALVIGRVIHNADRELDKPAVKIPRPRSEVRS